MYNSVSSILNEALDIVDLSANDAVVTSANISKYIWREYEKIYWEIENHSPGFFGTIGYVPFYANTENYKLSAHLVSCDGYNPIYSVFIKQSDNAQYYPGVPLNVNDIRSSASVFSWTSPNYYFFGDSLFVKPTPEAAATSAVKIYHTPYPKALSATTSEHNLPEGMDIALLDQTVAYIFDRLHDYENANIWKQRSIEDKVIGFNRINNRDKKSHRNLRDIRDFKY